MREGEGGQGRGGGDQVASSFVAEEREPVGDEAVKGFDDPGKDLTPVRSSDKQQEEEQPG
eukprot:765640-Hanusia_phi.AAC.1